MQWLLAAGLPPAADLRSIRATRRGRLEDIRGGVDERRSSPRRGRERPERTAGPPSRRDAARSRPDARHRHRDRRRRVGAHERDRRTRHPSGAGPGPRGCADRPGDPGAVHRGRVEALPRVQLRTAGLPAHAGRPDRVVAGHASRSAWITSASTSAGGAPAPETANESGGSVRSVAPELHEDLRPLAFLLGTWRGEGRGEYPTIDPFSYVEELTFDHVGDTFLCYQESSWSPEDGAPIHLERGFLRPGGTRMHRVHAGASDRVDRGRRGGARRHVVRAVVDRASAGPRPG